MTRASNPTPAALLAWDIAVAAWRIAYYPPDGCTRHSMIEALRRADTTGESCRAMGLATPGMVACGGSQ